MYKITRFFQNNSAAQATVRTGLSLDEAQSHCKDPETSASTCSEETQTQVTKEAGVSEDAKWFDGYTED